MGKKVYANGREIVAAASDCKVIAAMPDVCLSPPPPPAGPVPIPYPDSSSAKDLKKGSKDVKIGGGPVALQDVSHYKSSPLGDEASTKSFGANIIDHGNAGKTYNAAFSMDVTFEDKSVPRAMDLTTSNHTGAQPSGGALGPNIGGVAPGGGGGGETEKCPCCSGPAHANQKGPGVKKVTEADWYGPDGHAAVQRARALGCPAVPATADEKCGTYFVQPNADQRHKARKKWERNKRAYVEEYELLHKAEIAAGTRSRINPGGPKELGDEICHKVPISAGGCTTNADNLHPKKHMSQQCQDLDDTLTDFHTKRVMDWDALPR